MVREIRWDGEHEGKATAAHRRWAASHEYQNRILRDGQEYAVYYSKKLGWFGVPIRTDLGHGAVELDW